MAFLERREPPLSTKIRWSSIVELVGLLGVIGSRIFVGIDVRQSTIATRQVVESILRDPPSSRQ